jgi:hypothetical protein
MICPFCRLETPERHVRHADCAAAQKRAHDDVDARLARIKVLMNELMRTPRPSLRHLALVEEIHAETAAYLAAVEAVRGGDRKTDRSD